MPPPTHARTVGDMAATGLVPLGLYLLLRRRLDRVRHLAWDEDRDGDRDDLDRRHRPA